MNCGQAQAVLGTIAARLAVGASRGRLIRQLLTEAALLFLLGGAAGLVTAFALSRLVGGLLCGIGPGDPLTYAGAAAIFIIVTVAACWAPARRAAADDPVNALRIA